MNLPCAMLRPATRVSASAASPSPWRCRSSRVSTETTSELSWSGAGMYSAWTLTASNVVTCESCGSCCSCCCASSPPVPAEASCAAAGAVSRAAIASDNAVRGRVMVMGLAALCFGGCVPARGVVARCPRPRGSSGDGSVAGVGGVEAAGPALPPGVVGVLDGADVVHLGEVAADRGQVGVGRHRRLVGAVDEGRGEGRRLVDDVVAAGGDARGGGAVGVVVERGHAGEEHRIEAAAGV